MLVKDVLIKLSEEIVNCARLESTLKAKGFVVPSELTACKEELQFVYGYVHSYCDSLEEPFKKFWKSMKENLARLENSYEAFIENQGCISVTHGEKIKEYRRVLKVLETMFPEEVKASEVPPTAAVTITAEAVATWLQSKPTDAEITNVLSTIRGNASDLYEKFIELDIKRAHRELIEGIQALLNKQ